MAFLPKGNLCTLFNGRGFTPKMKLKILTVNLFLIIYYHTMFLALVWATFIENTLPIIFTVQNESYKTPKGLDGGAFLLEVKIQPTYYIKRGPSCFLERKMRGPVRRQRRLMASFPKSLSCLLRKHKTNLLLNSQKLGSIHCVLKPTVRKAPKTSK